MLGKAVLLISVRKVVVWENYIKHDKCELIGISHSGGGDAFFSMWVRLVNIVDSPSI